MWKIPKDPEAGERWFSSFCFLSLCFVCLDCVDESSCEVEDVEKVKHHLLFLIRGQEKTTDVCVFSGQAIQTLYTLQASLSYPTSTSALLYNPPFPAPPPSFWSLSSGPALPCVQLLLLFLGFESFQLCKLSKKSCEVYVPPQVSVNTPQM